MRKILAWAAVLMTIGLVAGEVAARVWLGLGDPALSVKDNEIDYLFAPNQDCRRFGNRIRYNNRSMRMDYDIPEGARTAKRRVMVCGDSVVNGGSLTDQSEVATSIVQGGYPTNEVQVCNVSAGSWGAGNLAAYFRKYGCMEATDLIVEMNSHDLWEDDPTQSKGSCVGKDVAFPDKKPVLAIWELVNRYLWPRMRWKLGLGGSVNTKVDVAKWGDERELAAQEYNLKAMEYLYGLPIAHKALVIHRSRQETRSKAVTYGEVKFREQAESLGVRVYLLELDAEEDYRDNIHLNAAGQKKLAALISRIIEEGERVK